MTSQEARPAKDKLEPQVSPGTPHPFSEDLSLDSREHGHENAGRSSYLLVSIESTSELAGLHPRHMHAPRKHRYRDHTRLSRDVWNMKGSPLYAYTMTTSGIPVATMAGNGGSGTI